MDYKGYTIKIEQDTDVESPRREYDNLGTMTCWHPRYILGDDPTEYWQKRADAFQEYMFVPYRPKAMQAVPASLQALLNNPPIQGSDEEMTRWAGKVAAAVKTWKASQTKWVLRRDVVVILPLYLYDHSGLSISTASFKCDPQGWDTSAIGYIYITRKQVEKEYGWKVITKERREKLITYLKGEVKTYDSYLRGDVWGYTITGPDGENVDGCWGFYGYDYCREEAKAVVDYTITNKAVAAANHTASVMTQHHELFVKNEAMGL